MHVCFHGCYVLSCFVCFVCIFFVYIRIYLSICIFVCVYIYVCFMYVHICICVYIYVYSSVLLSMYVLVHIFVHIKSYLFNFLSCRYLGCHLSVWHCYLGNILAFSFKIIKLNTATCTKSSTQVIKINLGNMNSLFPNLIVNNSGCMY